MSERNFFALPELFATANLAYRNLNEYKNQPHRLSNNAAVTLLDIPLSEAKNPEVVQPSTFRSAASIRISERSAHSILQEPDVQKPGLLLGTGLVGPWHVAQSFGVGL